VGENMGEIHECWLFMLEITLIKHFLNCNIDRENNVDLNREYTATGIICIGFYYCLPVNYSLNMNFVEDFNDEINILRDK
jgi:hypothetical protein